MPKMPTRPPIGAADSRPDTSAPDTPYTPAQQSRGEPLAASERPEKAAEVATTARSRRRRPRIVVEGGRSPLSRPGASSDTSQAAVGAEYPVQSSKVQAPPLREDTLARDRLLDWLSVKIHSRVVLLVAEAGYGKTTLLADFSRRTRVRTLWFRLDRGDRDWVGFIAHLVAAVRIHMPGFGPATAALLRETATSAPSIDTVLDTFLRELAALPNDPTALVLDDVHLVDDAEDVRHVLRELLARSPERMSFVFASRREPPLKLARLRALGEVVELRTDDLRFDASETERLFRESYDMRLEPSVLSELNRRTEGWAASLQLVRAALRDRNAAQVRTFISSLSGAEGHLYEYLAEEVIGDLSPELQQFLMRTSVLETVDLTLGPVAAGISEAETRAFIEEGERHGLFSKGGPNTRDAVRAHPLVRDFLQARLAHLIGEAGVQAIHLDVARAAEPLSWQIATRHYLAGRHGDDARRVISLAIERILATGTYAAAQELAELLPNGMLADVAGLVIRSRLAQQGGSFEEGLELAEAAFAQAPGSIAALLNLVTARTLAGDVAGSLKAGLWLEKSARSDLASIGKTFRRVLQTSVSGSVDEAGRELEQLAPKLRAQGATHYLGVALFNLTHVLIAKGEFKEAERLASDAISLLEASSAGNEFAAARIARATALAFLGAIDEAREQYAAVLARSASGQLLEHAIEIGQLEGLVGQSRVAWSLFESVDPRLSASTDLGEQYLYSRALLHVQDGNLVAARADISNFRHGEPRSSMAFEARRSLLEGLVLTLEGADGSAAIQSGATLASEQGATFWVRYGTLLAALAGDGDPSDAIRRASKNYPVVISALAEAVLPRLPDLDSDAANIVGREAEFRPWRWRAVARRLLESGDQRGRNAAAAVLESIGEHEDIARLRDSAKHLTKRGPRHGYVLARRLAPRVFIEDLGRLRITVGSRTIEGGEMRRRVLALLCLLVSRPGYAATRDEVIDSLWPENDPSSALNSLNQTVYFLRRVFEPEFRDDVSPGYVGQDGETVWLDDELVDSRSRRCQEIMRLMPGAPTPDQAVALATEYVGRFALDFAYEEWAATYRDALHAAYLRVVEHAIRLDLDTGHFSRGTFIAERAAEVDPDAEEVQVALVRLYRHSGAHAAAAEQYAHYARSMRELGIEPPAFAEI
jgi:LuxR family maltose regulon positive regulatory protein